jgi:hypothetical protein
MHAVALRDDGANWVEGIDVETRCGSAGLKFANTWPGLTVLQDIMAKVCPDRGHEIVAWVPDNRPARRKADRRAMIALACKGDGQTVSIPDAIGPHHVVAVGPDGFRDIETSEVMMTLDALMAKVCLDRGHEIVATAPDNRARRPADRGRLVALRCT